VSLYTVSLMLMRAAMDDYFVLMPYMVNIFENLRATAAAIKQRDGCL
jgi:hypothetical protein